MNIKIKEVEIFNSLIKRHIRTLKREDRSEEDKNIDYIFLNEAVELIIREHKLSKNFCERANIMKIILEVYEVLYDYLAYFNQNDDSISNLYDMLDKEIYGYN